jgi:hypothetical protein
MAKLWKPSTLFTPDAYLDYEKMEKWEKDDQEWIGEEGQSKYDQHWSGTVDSWVSQARSEQDKVKNAGRKALKQVEYLEDASQVAYSIERSLAYTPLAIAHAYIQEQVALLCSNPPHGTISSTQEAEGPYVGAMNQLLEAEFKCNNFEQTLYDTVYDGAFFNVGWWKTSVDYNKYGTFGQKGKIQLDRIDPDDMHVDPRAKNLRWEDMAYIVQQMSLEIGEIRELYPITGFLIPDEMESSTYSSMQDQKAEDSILSPVNKLASGQSMKRQKIKVYEAWFKDTRLKFAPDRKDRTYINDHGESQVEKDALALDEDGYVLGDWVPAYPKGRCIVVCEGVVLEDMPNRLPHGSCPFIPVKQSPSKALFVAGDATRIVDVAIKINDIKGRLHAYMQSEIERPMHASMGCFPNAQYYKKVPNKSDRIVFVNPNGVFMRPPAVDPPASTFTVLQMYSSDLDLISGSSALMRGIIPTDSQIGGDALQSMQNFASSRLALKAKYLASAVKEATRQIMWLIRRVVDEKITVNVTMPDGQSMPVDWESDIETFLSGTEEEIEKLVSREGYIVDIKTGTGSPNAQATQQASADKLYNMKAIPREALLDTYQWPNRKAIVKQMDAKEASDLAAQAAGRKLGMDIAKVEKMDDKPGRPDKSGPS